MKLTLFELKKLLADKALTVFFALAVCAAAVYAAVNATPISYDRTETERILSLFEASPEQTYLAWEQKQQAYRDLLSEEADPSAASVLSDFDSYRRAWEAYSRQSRYHERLENVLHQAQGNDAVSTWMVSLYRRNQTLRLSHADMQGLPELFASLSAASALSLLWAVLLGISIAYADRKSNAEPLLFACANGRARTRLAKLFAAWICTACVSALLFLAVLLPFLFQNGFLSWGAYLQNHETFFVCPYPLTVWQAVLILLLLTWLGAFALGISACLIGKYTRRQAIALLLALLIAVCFGALSLYRFPDSRNLLRLVSPFSFCDASVAFGHLYGASLGTFAVGGLPLVACAWCLLCALLCAVFACHHIPAATDSKTRMRLPALPSLRIPQCVQSVGAFEAAKQLLCGRAHWLLLPLLLLFACLTAKQITPDQSYTEQTYRACIQELQGTYTSEKQQLADSALAEVQNVLAQRQEMDALFASGELTNAEMSAYLRRFGIAQASEQALLRVTEQLAFVRGQCDAGQPAEIVCDSGWNVLFSLDLHIFPMLLVCAVCCGLFADEYKRGTHRLFPSSVRKRIALSKYLFALCFACLCAFCFEAVQIGLAVCRTPLALPFAPAASIPLANVFGGTPLLLAVCLSVLFRICAYAAVALACALCSRLLRQKHAAFVCGMLCAYLFL